MSVSINDSGQRVSDQRRLAQKNNARRSFCVPELSFAQFVCATFNYFFQIDASLRGSSQARTDTQNSKKIIQTLSDTLRKPVKVVPSQPQFMMEINGTIYVHRSILTCTPEQVAALTSYIQSIATIGSSLMLPSISPKSLSNIKRAALRQRRKKVEVTSLPGFAELKKSQLSTLISSILPEALIEFSRRSDAIPQAILIAQACALLEKQKVPCSYARNYFGELSGTIGGSSYAQATQLLDSIRSRTHLKGLPSLLRLEQNLGRTAELHTITQETITKIVSTHIEHLALQTEKSGGQVPPEITIDTAWIPFPTQVKGETKKTKVKTAKLASNIHPVTQSQLLDFLVNTLGIPEAEIHSPLLISYIESKLRKWHVSAAGLEAKRSSEIHKWGQHPELLMIYTLQRWLTEQKEFIGRDSQGDVRREDLGIFPNEKQSHRPYGSQPVYGHGYHGIRGSLLLAERALGDPTLRNYYDTLTHDEISDDLTITQTNAGRTTHLQVFYEIATDTHGLAETTLISHARQQLLEGAISGLKVCKKLLGAHLYKVMPYHLPVDDRLAVLREFAIYATTSEQAVVQLLNNISPLVGDRKLRTLDESQSLALSYLLILYARRIEAIDHEPIKKGAQTICKLLFETHAVAFAPATQFFTTLPNELRPYKHELSQHLLKLTRRFAAPLSPESSLEFTRILQLTILLNSSEAFEPLRAVAIGVVERQSGKFDCDLNDRSKQKRVFRLCWNCLSRFAPNDFNILRKSQLTNAIDLVEAGQANLDIVCSYAFPHGPLDVEQRRLQVLQMKSGNYPVDSWRDVNRDLLFGESFREAISSPELFLIAMSNRYGETHERARAVMALSSETRANIIKRLPDLSATRHLPFLSPENILTFSDQLSEQERYLFVSRGFYDAYVSKTTVIKEFDLSDDVHSWDNPFFVLGIPCKVSGANDQERIAKILAFAKTSRDIIRRIFHADQFNDDAARLTATERVQQVDAAYDRIDTAEKLMRITARLKSDGLLSRDEVAPKIPWYEDLKAYFGKIRNVAEKTMAQRDSLMGSNEPKRPKSPRLLPLQTTEANSYGD